MNGFSFCFVFPGFFALVPKRKEREKDRARSKNERLR
jgi:hypothetical protein